MRLTRRFSSPLRYPGGKAILTGFIEDLLTENDLVGGHYVEPFAGGSGIAIALLEDEYVESVYINDLDSGIFAFWHSLLCHSEEFLRLYQDIPVNMETWKRMRHIFLNHVDYSEIEYGFAVFFLNRCNRSGIISGGPIGGYAQTGNYSLGCRYGTDSLLQRLNFVANNANRIHAYNKDAIAFIVEDVNQINGKTLTFIDPPYYDKGHQLYLNHYEKNDHKELFDTIHERLNKLWVVTYDNVDAIKEIYQPYPSLEYTLNYTVHRSRKGSELLFHSPGLKMPVSLRDEKSS